MTNGAGILDRVHAGLRERAAAATDPRMTVGERAILVEVGHPAHGHLAGLAHRPPDGEVGVEPDSVRALADLAVGNATPLERAAGVAALNALSVPDLDWQAGDPMAALTADVETVATVGLFRPAFRTFEDVTVRVVERDRPTDVDAPPGVDVEVYAPAGCEAAFEGADVAFVTGATLVSAGIGRYLAALERGAVAPVVLVGATASHRPRPAFEAGVDVLAGANVADVERVRARVAAGDCGTDLHEAGLEKGYVTAGRSPSGLDLPGTATPEDTHP